MSKDTNDCVSERIDKFSTTDLLDEKRQKRLMSNRVSAHKYREKQKNMIQSLQFDLEQKDKQIKLLNDSYNKLVEENKSLTEVNSIMQMKIAEYENIFCHLTAQPNSEAIQENSIDSNDIRSNDTDSIEDFTGQSPQFDSLGDFSNSSDHDNIDGFFGYGNDQEGFEDRSQFWIDPELNYDFFDTSHNFDRINSYFIVLIFIFPIFIAPWLSNLIGPKQNVQPKRYGFNDASLPKPSMSFSSFGQNKDKMNSFHNRPEYKSNCVDHSCDQSSCLNIRSDIDEYFIRYIGGSSDYVTIDQCINSDYIKIDNKDKSYMSTDTTINKSCEDDPTLSH